MDPSEQIRYLAELSGCRGFQDPFTFLEYRLKRFNQEEAGRNKEAARLRKENELLRKRCNELEESLGQKFIEKILEEENSN